MLSVFENTSPQLLAIYEEQMDHALLACSPEFRAPGSILPVCHQQHPSSGASLQDKADAWYTLAMGATWRPSDIHFSASCLPLSAGPPASTLTSTCLSTVRSGSYHLSALGPCLIITSSKSVCSCHTCCQLCMLVACLLSHVN